MENNIHAIELHQWSLALVIILHTIYRF